MATVKVQDLHQHKMAEHEKFRAKGGYSLRQFLVQIPECAHLYKVDGMHWREIYKDVEGAGFGKPGRWFRHSEVHAVEGGFSISIRQGTRHAGTFHLTVYVPADTEIRVRSISAV